MLASMLKGVLDELAECVSDKRLDWQEDCVHLCLFVAVRVRIWGRCAPYPVFASDAMLDPLYNPLYVGPRVRIMAWLRVLGRSPLCQPPVGKPPLGATGRLN